MVQKAGQEACSLVGSLLPLKAHIAQPLRAGSDLQRGRLVLPSHCSGEEMRLGEAGGLSGFHSEMTQS